MKLFDKNTKYFTEGIMLFITFAALILFYTFLKNLNFLGVWMSNVVKVASPFFWGFVIAYMLNPIYKRILKLFAKKIKKGAKVLALVITYIIFFVFVCWFFYLLVPQVVKTLAGLGETLPFYANRATYEITQFISNYLERFDMSTADINGVLDYVTNNVFANFNINNIVQSAIDFMIRATVSIKNCIMGIIISIYFLVDKERFIKTGKKIIYVLFDKKNAEAILDFCSFTDLTFGQFILSKVVDSAIIGVICYFGMLILRLEYPLLIAIIIGVTNVIPFFGPFIGAIPSALLLFLVKPMEALIFVIFILVLQQFDGNILGPKLMGDSIGIRAVFVIFAVVIGGGFFGVVGMFIGVPVFAVLYELIARFINRKLSQKGICLDETD